jgi:hypothetical protein
MSENMNDDTNVKCKTCIPIPDNPGTTDYFEAIKHWIAAVESGRAEVMSGDGPISDVIDRIKREDQFVYEHIIKCECGTICRCAICIRSSESIIQIIA